MPNSPHTGLLRRRGGDVISPVKGARVRMEKRSAYSVLVALTFLAATPAYAHHEAIFGPQSSAVLSAGRFLSAQIFTRDTGDAPHRRRQTTTVFSGGLQPFKRPLSIAAVVPVSFIGSGPGNGAVTGIEDSLISARYRMTSDRLTESLGLDESYIMGVGGLELPTGTVDHDFGRGAVGAIAAGLISLERRPFSLIGYGYYHHTGDYKGTRESGNVFVGTGGAWTPVDNLASGRLVSLQLGLSHERTFAQQANGVERLNSGGTGIFLHQGVVLGVNERIQIFALVSLPIQQRWRAPEDRQRFRIGAGTILIFD